MLVHDRGRRAAKVTTTCTGRVLLLDYGADHGAFPRRYVRTQERREIGEYGSEGLNERVLGVSLGTPTTRGCRLGTPGLLNFLLLYGDL